MKTGGRTRGLGGVVYQDSHPSRRHADNSRAAKQTFLTVLRYDVNAAFMLLRRHERGIHALSSGRGPGSQGHESLLGTQ
jgi:hypothetical protein